MTFKGFLFKIIPLRKYISVLDGRISRYSFLLSILFGLVLGLFVKTLDLGLISTFSKISNLVIHIGYYFFYPMLFFSVVSGVSNFCQSNKFHIIIQTVITSLLNTIVISMLISLVFIFMPFERLPILNYDISSADIPNVYDSLLKIFPKNTFSIFFSESIFSIIFFAIIFGYFFQKQRYLEALEDIFKTFTSLGFLINNFFLYISYFLSGFFSFYFIQQVKFNFPTIKPFLQIIIYCMVSLCIIIFVFIPIMIFFITKKNPILILIYSLKAMLASFFTSDCAFALACGIEESPYTFKYKRETSSVIYSISFVFSRAGTVIVSMITFIAIIHTFIKIDIGIIDYLRIYIIILFGSVIFSFSNINIQTHMILVFLVSFYREGVDSGNILIIYPIVFLLDSIANIINVALSTFILNIIAIRNNISEDNIMSYF